mgnify:FL=1
MVEMIVKIRVMDLPAFDLFKLAAPAWMKQVTEPDYKATKEEAELFGAIMEIAESNSEEPGRG